MNTLLIKGMLLYNTHNCMYPYLIFTPIQLLFIIPTHLIVCTP